MSIVNTLPLESNRQIKINFDGGDLSSDAGLLLIKELKTCEKYTKQLTENDRRRLDRLMENLQKEDRRGYDQEILEVLEFMKAHGVKLEQEAIRR